MLKFEKNIVTEAIDIKELGDFLFVKEEQAVVGFDEETRESTGEIIEKRGEFLVGTKQNRRSTRIKFPADVDLSGFGFRESVELIDPEFRYIFVPSQNGNREYFDLQISAKGLRKKAGAAPKMPPKKEEPKQQG